MSVETVVAPVVKGRARPEWTAWSESVDLDSSHVFALRVFYSKSLVLPGALRTSESQRRTSVNNATPRLQFVGNCSV